MSESWHTQTHRHNLLIFGGSTEGCNTRLRAHTPCTTSIDRTPTYIHPQRIREASTLNILLSAIHFRAMYVLVGLVVWAQGEIFVCKDGDFPTSTPPKVVFSLLECVYIYTSKYILKKTQTFSHFHPHTNTFVDVTHVIWNLQNFPGKCGLLAVVFVLRLVLNKSFRWHYNTHEPN